MRPSAHKDGARSSEAAAEHVTPYDRIAWAWTDTAVERLLVSGEQREELSAYFGADEYRDLRRLARAAHRAPLPPGAHRVIIVPGIMGSQLGLPRRAPLPHDVLWLDPVDIGSGRLSALRVPGGAGIRALGVVLYSYLRLKLHLRAAGLQPIFHDYDWRLGVEELGRELAHRVHAEPCASLSLVGHSMGGLLSRAALALPGTGKVERVVLLGTPNRGSFAAVQALRGTYTVVRKIARLDGGHSAEFLASEIFSTFPSLYQMLPASGTPGAPDLLDAGAWPNSGPRPTAIHLEAARALRRRLAPPDERFAVIVGINQPTVTGVARRRDDFEYAVTRDGDGTVPTSCAELAGARTYYVDVAHSELARDGLIARAIVDLIRRGVTRRLPRTAARRSRSRARVRISDAALRRTHVEKVDWASLEPEERRLYLQNLNEPLLKSGSPPSRRRSRRRPRRSG